MREFSPRLILVNFWDMDVAHWGAYSLYLQAITKTDRLCGMLWDEVQSNPQYKDQTTLLILPELGRDGDMNTANGFLNHRSGDPSCRHVWMLALGAGVSGRRDRAADLARRRLRHRRRHPGREDAGNQRAAGARTIVVEQSSWPRPHKSAPS